MLRFPVLASLLIGLSACSSNEDIQLDDTASFAQSLQLRYLPGAGTEQAKGVGIEVAYDRSEGDDMLDSSFGSVVFQGQNFGLGPVDAEWEQESYQVGVVFDPRPLSPNYDLAIGVGIRQTRFDLALDTTEGELRQTSLYGGVDYGYWFADQVGMFLRAMLAWSEPLEDLNFIEEGEEDMLQRLLELGLAVRAGSHFSLRAGWRSWDIDIDVPGASDVELDAAGPFIGLVLSF